MFATNTNIMLARRIDHRPLVNLLHGGTATLKKAGHKGRLERKDHKLHPVRNAAKLQCQLRGPTTLEKAMFRAHLRTNEIELQLHLAKTDLHLRVKNIAQVLLRKHVQRLLHHVMSALAQKLAGKGARSPFSKPFEPIPRPWASKLSSDQPWRKRSSDGWENGLRSRLVVDRV